MLYHTPTPNTHSANTHTCDLGAIPHPPIHTVQTHTHTWCASWVLYHTRARTPPGYTQCKHTHRGGVRVVCYNYRHPPPPALHSANTRTHTHTCASSRETRGQVRPRAVPGGDSGRPPARARPAGAAPPALVVPARGRVRRAAGGAGTRAPPPEGLGPLLPTPRFPPDPPLTQVCPAPLDASVGKCTRARACTHTFAPN